MTVAITATTQDVFPPRVQVAVTGLVIGNAVEVYREVDGKRTLVRAGSDAAVSDTSFIVIDAELPFGVPVTYVAVTNDSVTVNDNPNFETDTSGWQAGDGPPTIAVSTDQAHEGTHSMKITPPGDFSVIFVDESVSGTSAHTAVAGQSYGIQVWVYSEDGWSDVRPGIDWYDSDGTFLSGDTDTYDVPAATWTLLSNSFVAPADAAFWSGSIGMGGTPAATDVLYVDEFRLLDPNGDGTATVEFSTTATTYTLTGGKVVLTDAITGLAAEVIITAWPDKTRTRQSSAFVAGGRNVAVLGDLAGFTGTIDVYVETTSAVENLTTLLEQATSGIIQIRQAGTYDGVDCYIAVMGVTEHRFSQDGSDERRTVSIEALEVDGWPSALEARGFTLADIDAAYDGLTLADLAGDYDTLLDIALADWS